MTEQANVEISQEMRDEFHLTPDMQFYHGRGCEKCDGSGYKGRGAFMEVLPISPRIRGIIERGGDAEKLKELALQEGMVTLKEAGMRKVRAGVTSLEAAFEVTGGE